MEMLGRAAERRMLDELLAAARNGGSGAVVVRAEAGMGKSRLLQYAVASAADFRIAHIEGVESEMELGYAALHRLLLPFLDKIGQLPEPQQAALGAAFGTLSRGGPPDRFVVGLGTLSLLDAVARDEPLLCVVDDAHWLDRESLDALALAGRRLGADGVAMLFAARDVPSIGSTLEGIREARIGGLSERDAEVLIRRIVDRRLDDRSLARIVTETAGCPLAILELATELTGDELVLRGLAPDPLPIGRRLEDHFAKQIGALPVRTQDLLLVAAAEPSQDPVLIVEAGQLLGLDAADADPAAEVELFSLDARPLFRHSLIRSAVYGGASAAARRRAHAALATVTDARRDGDRRAWHRAAAALGADEEVAAELERGAERARARGGYSAAGVFLARAAALTPDAERRADRVLAAATNHLVGGAPMRARTLLASADLEFSDPWQRAIAMRLEGAIAYASGDMPRAVLSLLRAADLLARHDVVLARTTVLHAAAAARFAGTFCHDGGREVDVARAAAALPLPEGVEATAPHLLLDGYAALHLEGHAAAVPLLRRALASLAECDVVADEALLWLGTGCWVAGAIADDEALHTLSTRLVDAAREQGALVHLANGLLYSAMSHLLRGLLPEARSRFAERGELMVALGVDGDVGRMVVSAWGGPVDEVRSEMEAVRALAADREQGWMLVFVEYARAILELGMGNYEAAIGEITRDYDDDSFLVVVGFPNTIEALVRSGRRDEAGAALAVFTERTKSNATNLSLGLLARTRALLAEDHEVDGLCREAIDRLRRSRADLQLGRAHLLYGEWLRRQKRRTEARDQLRTAFDLFVARGVGPFSERARIELEATGERARARTVDTVRDLTPQERQIAMLAADALTNVEIAAKLFLSASTVDYHLRKVYRKLDIDSRRQLPRALGRA